ncbi:cell wall integrity and stress response component [Microdochium nivale]|nr:cell wall integrity and stress response component [Microdochium nivale]
MYLVLVGLLAVVAHVAAQAQGIPGLPTCATACLSSGFAQAGCSSNDLACQCGDISAAAGTATGSCLLAACDVVDIFQAQNALEAMCSSFSATGGVGGTPSTISGLPTAGSATATTTRTTTKSASTNLAGSSVTGAQETPATSLGTTATPTSSSTSSTIPGGSNSGNGGSTSSSSSSSSSPSGAMIGGIVGGVVGALLLGGLVVWLIMRGRGSPRVPAGTTSEEGQHQQAGMSELASTPSNKPIATAWAYPTTPGELPGASISPVSPHGHGYGPPPPWQPSGHHQSAELENAAVGPTELGTTNGLPPELGATGTVYTQPAELGSGNHGFMGNGNTRISRGA